MLGLIAGAVVQVALVEGLPKKLSLKQCLQHFLDFRELVVQRRATHALAKATARLHLVEGLLLALRELDDVVQVGGLLRTNLLDVALLSAHTTGLK